MIKRVSIVFLVILLTCGSTALAESGPLDGAARRSIYLESRRNFISPMMRTFDAPIPLTTIGRRTSSNLPAQSLILLNDPFVLGQAQAWARRVLADPDASLEARFDRIYLAAMARRTRPRAPSATISRPVAM